MLSGLEQQGLWAGTWGMCPACWGRRLALLPPTAAAPVSSEQGGREAGHGWVPDGLSGLPRVDSEAPLVSAAPSALIRLRGGSLLWNASETQPASPPAAPHPLCIGDSTLLSSPFSPSSVYSLPPAVERVRAGDFAHGWGPPIWDLSPIFP